MNSLLASLSSFRMSGIYSSTANIIREFTLHDAADILIVSFFMYVILLFIKQTRSYFIFNTVILLLIISSTATFFDLSLTRKLFEPILTFFLVIFVVVFQREIRRFFRWLSVRRGSIVKRKANASLELCDTLVESVTELAKRKSGAIIVLPGDYPLDEFIEGGISLDGKVSMPVILSIFDHTTPGHDGAIIIDNNRIRRFGVHLPLARAESYEGFAKAGTRHRAATGITEPTDALALIVSEERGVISIAERGSLRQIGSKEELRNVVKNFLKANEENQKETITYYLLIENFWTKLASIAIASILWVFLVFNTNIINRELTIPVEFKHVPETLKVDKISSQTAEITLSGDNADIQNLQQNDVRLVLDLEGSSVGTQQFSISSSTLNFPSYLTLVKALPQHFSVTLVPIQASVR